MRICLLSYRSNPHCGGQGVYIRHLSRELHRLGHHVDVVSGPPYPVLDDGVRLVRLKGLDLYNPDDLFRKPTIPELSDPINLMEWLGVSTMGFPEPFTFGMRAARYLKNHHRRYDIVHDNQSLSYGVFAVSRRIPTIVTIHHPITIDRDIAIKAAPNFWLKLKEMRWYGFIGMQKRVAKTIRRFITVSESARNDIVKEFKLDGHRFDIVPNGIDSRRFKPLPHIAREPGRIIVTSSADTPLKGLVHLLRAVADISRTVDVRLVVVGTPKENGTVMRMVHELGIRDRVCFTGPISHAAFAEQYARAWVAVVPSVYEGFGLPAGEAMACGVSVVSTTAGALPEVVGDAGLLVPPADHRALADALRKVLTRPGLAHDLGRAGYERVRRKFTWRRAAELTAAAYERTILDYRRFS